MINIGDQIPAIELKNQHDETVDLHALKGKPLVIYFYPKNNTKVCTAQACGFRDEYEHFQELGAEVIGISRDSVQSHQKVANKRRLPFLLLSDPDKKAHRAFGVPSGLLGLVPGRVTFIVDKNGIVLHTFRADFNASSHIKEAMSILKEH